MLTLTTKEQKTNDIMVRLVAKKIKVKDAARVLNLSKRQILRKKKAYIAEGIASIPHKNRGITTGRGFSQTLKSEIIDLYHNEYPNWNFHHFNNALEDNHGIKVSHSFLYNLMKITGIESPCKYKKRKRSYPPRPRKEFAGELLQCDASKHQWLPFDKGYYYLHGAIDDATGIVTAAYLCEQETIIGYQRVLEQTIKNYGLPECLYTDFRTIFQSNKRVLSLDEELKGKKLDNTKFCKMLKHLGIDIISTVNPRAKGRIERLWRTFQDRLFKELRRLKITTIKEANDFLLNEFIPTYNSRFASQIDSNKNLFVWVENDFDFNSQLAIWETKHIQHSCYISFKGSYHIIFENDMPVNFQTKAPVDVYTFLDGSVNVFYKDKFYKTMTVDHLPASLYPTASSPNTVKSLNKAHVPSVDHPWKKSKLTKNWNLYKYGEFLPR